MQHTEVSRAVDEALVITAQAFATVSVDGAARIAAKASASTTALVTVFATTWPQPQI